MIDAIVISAEEEKQLLQEWFDTVHFDHPDSGIPDMAPEKDDEESRMLSQVHALTEWFQRGSTGAPPIVDSATWTQPNLNLGMNIKVARSIYDTEASFHQLFMRTPEQIEQIKLSNRKATDLASRLRNPDSGFTVDPRTGKDIKQGYAIAVYSERAVEVNKVDKIVLEEYISKNSDLFADSRNMLNAWHNPDSDIVWLDVSMVVDDKLEAIEVAKEYDKQTILDLGSGNPINTSGTGRSSYPFVFTRANPYHDKAGKFASSSGHGKPLVVSREDFDSRFPDSEDHLYRGVKSEAGAEVTRRGELGQGDYGNGIYMGSLGTAQGYMQKFQGDESGVMIRGAIDKTKKPKIRVIPAKVKNKGSAEIDKWAEENNIDVIDTGSFKLIKNPGVMVFDSHNYTLSQSVVMDYKSQGYSLPEGEKYQKAAAELGVRANPYHSKTDGKFASKGGSGTPGPISAEQFKAITPGSGVGAIAARKELDKTPAGRQLRETTKVWQDDIGGLVGIQKGFMAKANGKKSNGPNEKHGTALMHAIKSAPVSPPIYRGARISASEVAGYTKGKSVILAPSSFTSSERIAGGFAKQPSKRDNIVPVLIRVRHGARAVPVEVYGDGQYKNEREWISAGQFTVTGVSKRSDGVHVIDVDHTAMFQW